MTEHVDRAAAKNVQEMGVIRSVRNLRELHAADQPALKGRQQRRKTMVRVRR